MAPRRKLRQREAQLAFEALSVEGGLISPEWLARVALLDAGHQTESDYRIPKGLNLRDEIGRYWRMAQAHWGDFARSWAAGTASKEVAESLVTSLLRDCLGFGSLVARSPVTLGERTYPVGWLALEGRVPVVLVAPRPPGAGEGKTALDDLSSELGDAGRRRSAFGLVQEYLNADEDALWAIISDGLTLRICRDNASLTRPAWIEADLDRIFREERYSDFAALWLLAHETRFGAPGQLASACQLEAWRTAGREEGTRAREFLRDGVEEALTALGQGFLANPENQALRAALHDGKLSANDYFQELLRLVYRLIFLLTAEERDLLHPAVVADGVRARYAKGYGLKRLRDRAVKRSAHDRFGDLWEGLKIVLRGVALGEPRLGLPALGGLFSASQCPHLDAAKLENRALLTAVFRLSWLKGDSGLARVNWRDMGPEELGSVYESLLELVPVIPSDHRGFSFATGAETKGNARKTTGSYYTPDSLVQVLLDSALEPVVQQTVAAHPDRPAEALLQLAIVDPACGSGHFLLAAADRLAGHVARLQAQGTPSVAEYRHAVREVVSRCLFGVDLNPMAVELCRLGLWMKAVEPGRPLSFLDSHIQQGNALLGTTPELMANGIPDAAFEPIEGDDRKTASLLKKKNKAAAEGQRGLDALWSKPAEAESAEVAKVVAALEAAPDASLTDVAGKEAQWEGLQRSLAFTHQKFVADAWCAAFVWPKPPTEPKKVDPVVAAAPTNDLWRQIRDGQGQPPMETVKTVSELARQYHFFHWHLAFPQVFARGGFDVVLGNPPWERVKLQEQEFFASRDPAIAAAPTAERKRLLEALPKEAPALWSVWKKASREAAGTKHFLRESGRYPRSGQGDVNTYALFAEHYRHTTSKSGRAGFIVPTGIATDDTTKDLFGSIVSAGELAAFFSFENEGRVFPSVHHAFKFALMTVDRSGEVQTGDYVFFARSVEDLRIEDRRFKLSAEDLALLSPGTNTCPTFRSRRDAELVKQVYRRMPALCSPPPTWNIVLRRMIHMADDAGLFWSSGRLTADGWLLEGNVFKKGERKMAPLCEAKLVHHFDHRFATYEGQTSAQENQGKCPELSEADHVDPCRVSVPRYWIPETEVEVRLEGQWKHGWMLGWRDICRSVDQRTLIASLIPRTAIAGFHQIRLYAEPKYSACLLGALCSFVVDYIARQKVGGTHLTYGILEQLPAPRPADLDVRAAWDRVTATTEWLGARVLELTYTAWDLEPFAKDVGYDGPPFRWDPSRRFLLRAELDAAFFHLYGISRDDADYILETFPIVKKNDVKAHGEYRTKRVILEICDEMAAAIRTGKPYQTRLDPPPAEPRVAHPSRVTKKRMTPARVEVLPDAAWQRPQPYRPADTGVVIAAVLKTLGGPTLASRVRLAAILSLEPRLVTSPDSTELAEWRRLVGSEASPLPPNVAPFVPRADLGWGGAVKLLRGNGLLVEDLGAKTWAPGMGLEEVATDGWADGRVRWVVDLIARRGEALAETLPEEIRRFVDEAA